MTDKNATAPTQDDANLSLAMESHRIATALCALVAACDGLDSLDYTDYTDSISAYSAFEKALADARQFTETEMLREHAEELLVKYKHVEPLVASKMVDESVCAPTPEFSIDCLMGKLTTIDQVVGYTSMLERERDAARAELTATKWALDSANAHNPLEEQLAEYKRMSESGESLGGELEERERRIAVEAQLAIVQQDCRNLTEKVIPNINEQHEKQLAELQKRLADAGEGLPPVAFCAWSTNFNNVKVVLGRDYDALRAAAESIIARNGAEIANQQHDITRLMDSLNSEVNARFEADAEIARLRKDAERWNRLPAFLEKYQIDYVSLLHDIDADLAEIDAARKGRG